MKDIVVICSGGMDSSICLAYAKSVYSKDKILALSFNYEQRHSDELECIKKIASKWEIEHLIVDLNFLSRVTDNALVEKDKEIEHKEGLLPNTLVMGRNGLMARIGAMVAFQRGANKISMGIIGVEAQNSGYFDCTRHYMNKMEEVLKIDLDNPGFKIETPLVDMTKMETLVFAKSLGVLEYLLENTITCYEGIAFQGCKVCPACKLRNEGIREFYLQNSSKRPSYYQEIERRISD